MFLAAETNNEIGLFFRCSDRHYDESRQPQGENEPVVRNRSESHEQGGAYGVERMAHSLVRSARDGDVILRVALVGVMPVPMLEKKPVNRRYAGDAHDDTDPANRLGQPDLRPFHPGRIDVICKMG